MLPSSDPTKIVAVGSSQKTTKDASTATRGTITPLIDGEAALREMQESMSRAKSYIFISAWYLHVNTKLPCGKGTVQLDTLLKNLATQGKKIFILLSYLENRPIKIGKEKFNLFQQSRPASAIAAQLSRIHPNVIARVDKHPYQISLLGMTRILASQHEKFMVVDGEVAFCGGLEFTRDYSTSSQEHNVPLGLRHDIHTKCEGSVAAHFDTHFRARWIEVENLKIKESSRRKPSRVVLPKAGTPADNKVHAVQVVRTRTGERMADGAPRVIVREIYDSYIAAINEAKKLIYIEQQYFRERILAEKIAARLRDSNAANLEVIILLPERPEEPPSKLTDHVNYLQAQALEIVQQAAPSRVGFFSIRKVKSRSKTAIYVHSKIMIVDDKWVTIGSANTNPRSFWVDSEVNLLVRDDQVAKELRKALWKEHLQVSDKDLDESSIGKRRLTFLGMWKAVANGTYRCEETRRRPNNRTIIHKPLKGKRINLEDFGIQWYQRMFLPDIDLLALQTTDEQKIVV